VIVALAACDSGGHDELPGLPGAPATYDTSRIVSPSYTSTTTTIPDSIVTPPPTPDWRSAPPTVLIYVTEPEPAPAPPPARTRRTEPPAPPPTDPPATDPPATAPPLTEPVVETLPPELSQPFRPEEIPSLPPLPTIPGFETEEG